MKDEVGLRLVVPAAGRSRFTPTVGSEQERRNEIDLSIACGVLIQFLTRSAHMPGKVPVPRIAWVSVLHVCLREVEQRIELPERFA